jgi:hypothetical protein
MLAEPEQVKELVSPIEDSRGRVGSSDLHKNKHLLMAILETFPDRVPGRLQCARKSKCSEPRLVTKWVQNRAQNALMRIPPTGFAPHRRAVLHNSAPVSHLAFRGLPGASGGASRV